MKYLFLFLMLFFGVNNSNAQSYAREGNTYISSTGERTAKQPTKTKFTWKDSKGKEYPIFISPNGSCFVIKTSQKTGKEYRYYLGAEISSDICKQLNVEYKPRNKK